MDEEIFIKEPKTRAGDRYVYFSAEMESLLWEYRQECAYITETYGQREMTDDDFLFRRQGVRLPMTPTTFTYRFKLILKKNGLPQELNVHSLRHTAASLMIAGGTDVATVAGILGHSQPSTTLDIYTHAFDKNKRRPAQSYKKGWIFDFNEKRGYFLYPRFFITIYFQYRSINRCIFSRTTGFIVCKRIGSNIPRVDKFKKIHIS